MLMENILLEIFQGELLCKDAKFQKHGFWVATCTSVSRGRPEKK
jgi:hypothetical protein